MLRKGFSDDKNMCALSGQSACGVINDKGLAIVS